MKLSGLTVRRRIVAQRVSFADSIDDLRQRLSCRTASTVCDLSACILRDLRDADPLELGARDRNDWTGESESEALPHLNAVYVGLKLQRRVDDLILAPAIEKTERDIVRD